MRVARWYNNRDVRVEEIPVPRIGPGELLVRVEASGICGSDVMEWYRLDRAPLVLGHEIGGQVAWVGEGVTQYAKGDRVTVAHHVPCNTCYYCLGGHHTVCDTLRQTNIDPGGFAEYARLPAINVERGVFRLPAKVTYEMATFVEPMACVLRGQRQANLKPGQSVLVIGSGIAGLLHVLLARTMGAGVIAATDVVPFRLKAAEQLGADYAIPAEKYSPDQFREFNQGRLADLVIVGTGAKPAFEQALASVARGGTVLFFAPTAPGVAIQVSINELFWRNDVTLTTSYASSPADYQAALDMISERNLPVTRMITHRLSLAETGLGFQLVSEARDSIKVIIEPQR
ncbi:MAG: zinc-dependent dehydrogenase [Chloroflexota bacterium]